MKGRGVGEGGGFAPSLKSLPLSFQRKGEYRG